MNKSVKIFSTVENLSLYFAQTLAKYVSKTPEDRFFSLALSGGSTPKVIFEFIRFNFKNKINWSKIIIFWGDERCVSSESDESNYKMASESLLKHIPIPYTNIFRIKGEEDPATEANRYSEIVSKLIASTNGIPQFDLIMLGLGEDAHTASIFPNNIHLFDSKKLFEVSKHPDTKQKRITATGKIINNSKAVFFIATGKKKSEKVYQILEKKNKWKFYPASLVDPKNGELIWLLDNLSAEQLSGGVKNAK
ncbi:MAG: 6-phosphogluconolactonase [Ignavibacteria bacterium]|nr:6-phosphogluconolactonase [Ignavibacteria bacterium]